jgi:hypothetical protein
MINNTPEHKSSIESFISFSDYLLLKQQTKTRTPKTKQAVKLKRNPDVTSMG